MLLADENFPAPAITHLRQSGHDVLTLLQTGMAGQAYTINVLGAFVFTYPLSMAR